MTLNDYALYDEVKRRLEVAIGFPDSDRAKIDIEIYTLALLSLENKSEVLVSHTDCRETTS